MDRNTRALAAVVLAAIALFLGLALFRLDRPGLYADEVIFAPGTLQMLWDRGIDAAVTLRLGRIPLLASPFYVGSLKSLLYAPVLALVEPDALSLRLPMVLVAAGTVGALGWFVGRRLGVLPAAVLMALVAVDPAFLSQARFDWGPVVLATAFKLVACGCLVAFAERPRAWLLVVAEAALLLGFYDKLSFLWVIVAIVVAGAGAYGDRLWAWARRRPRQAASIVGPFAAACLPFGYLVLKAMRLDLTGIGAGLPLLDRLGLLARLYVDTMDGGAVYGWMFGQAGLDAVSPWVAWLLPVELLAGLAVTAAVIRHRDRSDPVSRAIAFLSLLVAALVAEMVATRQTSFAHHVVVLWPFGHVLLVLLGVLAIRRGAPARTPAIAAGCLLVAAIVAAELRVDAAYAARLADGRGYNRLMDPAIRSLADRLNATPADAVLSLDWGLHEPLVLLAPADRRARYRSVWGWFAQTKPGEPDAALRGLLSGHPTLVVTHPGDQAEMRRVNANFRATIERLGLCVVASEDIAGTGGRAIYRIMTVEPRCRTAGERTSR